MGEWPGGGAWNVKAGSFLMTHERHDVQPDDERHLSLVNRRALTYRLLTTSDILAFRALRLDALRLHPEAFVPTYEEEREIDPAMIAPRFRNDWISGGNFIIGAHVFGWLAGAVGVRRWPRQKQRHKATLWLLYARSDVRGQGIGRELLDLAIARCQQDLDVEQLHLSVGCESHAARRLYRDRGFRRFGLESAALKLGDRSIDVELMALPVKELPA